MDGWKRSVEAAIEAEGATPVASRAAVEHALNLHWWDEDGEPCACGFDFIAAGQSFKMHLGLALLAAGVFREPPTREQIEHAIDPEPEERHPDSPRTLWIRRRESRNAKVDAVLALMGGAER